MKNEKDVLIGHNQNPIQEHLLEVLDKVRNTISRKHGADAFAYEVIWQIEEVLERQFSYETKERKIESYIEEVNNAK